MCHNVIALFGLGQARVFFDACEYIEEVVQYEMWQSELNFFKAFSFFTYNRNMHRIIRVTTYLFGCYKSLGAVSPEGHFYVILKFRQFAY